MDRDGTGSGATSGAPVRSSLGEGTAGVAGPRFGSALTGAAGCDEEPVLASSVAAGLGVEVGEAGPAVVSLGAGRALFAGAEQPAGEPSRGWEFTAKAADPVRTRTVFVFMVQP